MDSQEREKRQQELAELKQRVAQLEQELADSPPHWEATEFYTGYYATAGFVLGMFAAMTSLLFNVIGAAGMGEHPLKLIQVYLTFPLGETALTLDGGMTLIFGCCLYIATGMLFGAIFHTMLAWFAREASTSTRMVLATFMALGMWIVHFYGVLNWLQPMLFGGDWIVKQIPWWVAMLTHLVYGWTMAVMFPFGQYVPYRRQTEQA
ncbi:MAG: hypothetical protein KDB14_27875 [Planctomycetales bacterium]|nr:hypothetical protein [Planctomycetales bacterium]